MFAIPLCRSIARIRFDVEHSRHPNYLENLENLELTLKYILQILAMSGLTGFLVKRIFAGARGGINVIPQSVLRRLMMQMQMQIISYHHEQPTKFSIQPSGLGIVSLHTRVFRYVYEYKALLIGNENGQIDIVFSDDGRHITYKMAGSIADISMLNKDTVVVCNADNYAYVMRIANGGLKLVCRLGHGNDVTSASGNTRILASGSRDKSVKIWEFDPNGVPVCLQTLTDHNSRVISVLVHDEEHLIVVFTTNNGEMYMNLLSKDGKNVLSCKRINGKFDGELRTVFHSNPDKKILFSGGYNGKFIVTRFKITPPSNEFLTESSVFTLPNLKGYRTVSISSHFRLPILLICVADINCEKLPNRTIAVVFSNGFEKVLSIMILHEGSPNGGSARAVFSCNGEVLFSDYKKREVLEISDDNQ